MSARFTYRGRVYDRQNQCPDGQCSAEDVSAWRGYATQAVGALYRMSLQGDGGQQSDLQITYCEIVDGYVAAAKQLEDQPGGATNKELAWIWAQVAGAAIQKMEKYGAQPSFTNPTFERTPQSVTTKPCRGDEIPPDDGWLGPGSILGEAAGTLDDAVKTTSQILSKVDSLLGRFESALPYLIAGYALMQISTAVSAVSSFSNLLGGGRK